MFHRFPDTLSHMTPDDVFRENIINILTHLNSKLPNGSHVLLTGLANGSAIYEIMNDRTYVLGKLKNDVKYKDLFKFLTCLQVIGQKLKILKFWRFYFHLSFLLDSSD